MGNQFSGKNHSIGLEAAKKMTRKFREHKDKIVKDEYKDKHILPFCESFDRSAFDTLLQREDCKGIRIYYGMKEEDKKVHAVIVGFDADGRDILPAPAIAMDATDPIIVEDSKTCPPDCPPPSDLNT